VIHGAAGYLSEAFVQEDFDFYGRTLSGTLQLRERWKRGVSLVERAMGEAVGRAYVGRHFPPGARERMDVLVANLLEAYRQSIENLEWMGADTRRRALDKLEKFTPKIGYPVMWRDYSSLRMATGRALQRRWRRPGGRVHCAVGQGTAGSRRPS
jgi:putative endopeptidase